MVKPPQDWKPGTKIASPVEEMVTLDLAGMASTPIYKLLIGAIVPRPIALVSTVNEEGIVNLAAECREEGHALEY